jgi:hypothetical protein
MPANIFFALFLFLLPNVHEKKSSRREKLFGIKKTGD